MREQGSLDFVQLDAVTARLNLAVLAAEELVISIRHTLDQVAGAVVNIFPAAGGRAAREAALVQIRAAPVAFHNRSAADEQFADFAGRHGLVVPVYHQAVVIGAYDADRDRLIGIFRQRDHVIKRTHVGLSRAV